MHLCRECPDQLKETISSLIFAASRCGEFPELQKIRENLASQFGNKFAACAVELRNNCGVNPMVRIQFTQIRISKHFLIPDLFPMLYPR